MRGIADGIGSDPDLAFHALNFGAAGSPDVSIGTGVLTEARTSTIYLPDDSGIWRPFTSGIPGKVFANGRWWLYGGPAGTNELTRSFDLSGAAWAETGTDVAALDAIGLEGVANTASTLTDNDGSAIEFLLESISIPDDSNPNVLRIFVKKDAITLRFPEFRLRLTAGTQQRSHVQLNTLTGEAVIRFSEGTVAVESNSSGDWWELLFSVINNGTGNNNANILLFPAFETVFENTGDVAATGSIIVGNVELHLNKTIAQVRGTTPIFTSGSTVTVDAADPSFDDENHADLEGAYFCEFKNVGLDGPNNGGLLGLGSSGKLIYADSAGQFENFDGNDVAFGPGITLAADDVEYKIGVAYGDGLHRLNTDGVWGTADPYDGEFDNTLGKLNVLDNDVFSSEAETVMLMRNLRRYDLSYVDAQTKIDQLML